MKKYRIGKTELSARLFDAAHEVQREELAAAAKVMAAAFSDDASIRYLLGGEGEGEHDWRYFLCVLRAICGRCVMLASDEAVNSLLILFPPQLKAVPTIPFLLHGGIGLYRVFGPGLFLRSLRYENNCRAVKKRYTTPDAWYCMCFAVAPELQGKGIGSKLIRPALAAFEQNRVPLYLETHEALNVEIYEHYGFRAVGASTIPGTDIEQYSLYL